jgi:hypothetical protein
VLSKNHKKGVKEVIEKGFSFLSIESIKNIIIF